MKTRLLLQVNKWLALFILPLLFMAVAVDGVAQTQPDGCNATVVTDKADYAPGETVVITGTGWKPGVPHPYKVGLKVLLKFVLLC